MAAQTSRLALPYPVAGDPARIEEAVKPLAERLDSGIDQILETIVPQPGVWGAVDLKVINTSGMVLTTRGGDAWVRLRTGGRDSLHRHLDRTTFTTTLASHATLPRIDQVILNIPDPSRPHLVERRLLPGSPFAGATLDNRFGAAALPVDALRLADVLVPAGATSLPAGSVRDRRPWARGAYHHISLTHGRAYAVGTVAREIDAVSLAPRIECSGMPLEVTLRMRLTAVSSQYGSFLWAELPVAGTAMSPFQWFLYASNQLPDLRIAAWTWTPPAGSLRIAPTARSSEALAAIAATTVYPLEMTIREVVRQNANNT